jgi:hypothetical protein
MKADDTISAWSTNKPLAIVSAADTTFLRRGGYGCNPHRSKNFVVKNSWSAPEKILITDLWAYLNGAIRQAKVPLPSATETQAKVGSFESSPLPGFGVTSGLPVTRPNDGPGVPDSNSRHLGHLRSGKPHPLAGNSQMARRSNTAQIPRPEIAGIAGIEVHGKRPWGV